MPQSKKAKQSKKPVKPTSALKSSLKNGRSKYSKRLQALKNKEKKKFISQSKKIGLTVTQIANLLKWDRDYRRKYNREEVMKWKDYEPLVERKERELLNLRMYQNIFRDYYKKEQERRLKAFLKKRRLAHQAKV